MRIDRTAPQRDSRAKKSWAAIPTDSRWVPSDVTLAMELSGAFSEFPIRSTRKRTSKKQRQQKPSRRGASQAGGEAEPQRSEDKTGDNRPGLDLDSIQVAPEANEDDDGEDISESAAESSEERRHIGQTGQGPPLQVPRPAHMVAHGAARKPEAESRLPTMIEEIAVPPAAKAGEHKHGHNHGAVVSTKPTASAISTAVSGGSPEAPRRQPPRESAPSRPLFDSSRSPSLLQNLLLNYESDYEEDDDFSRLEHSHRPLAVAPRLSDFSYFGQNQHEDSDAHSEGDGGRGEDAQDIIHEDWDDTVITDDNFSLKEDKATSLVGRAANKHKLDNRQTSGNQLNLEQPPPAKRTKLCLDTTSAHTRTSRSCAIMGTAPSSGLSTAVTPTERLATALAPKPISIDKAPFLNATLPTAASTRTQDDKFLVPESARCHAGLLGGSTHIAASTGPAVDFIGPKIAGSGGQNDSTVHPAKTYSLEPQGRHRHHHDQQQQQQQQQQTQLQDFILLGQGGGDEATISSSLATLQGQGWLNDLVLDSAMRLVELVRPTHIYHINPSALRPSCRGLPWRKLLGMDLQTIIDSAGNFLEDHMGQQQQQAVEMVLIPRNVGKCHWVLFVALPLSQRIDLYDPLPGAGYNEATILSSLRTPPNTSNADVSPASELPGLRGWDSWPVTPRSCPRQSDTHSCGVFVIVFALYLCAGRPFPAELDGTLWRRLISDFCHDVHDWDQCDSHQDDRPDGDSDPAYAHECNERLVQIRRMTQETVAHPPSPSSRPATYHRSLLSFHARVGEAIKKLDQFETALHHSILTTTNCALDAQRVLQSLACALETRVTEVRLFEQRLENAISERRTTLHTARAWQNKTSNTAEAVITADIEALQEFLMSIRSMGKHSSAELGVGGVTQANLASLCNAAQLRFTRASNFAKHTAQCRYVWLEENFNLEEPK